MGVFASELPKAPMPLKKKPVMSFFGHAELENMTPENKKEGPLGFSVADILSWVFFCS